jgi:hypothetical protein
MATDSDLDGEDILVRDKSQFSSLRSLRISAISALNIFTTSLNAEDAEAQRTQRRLEDQRSRPARRAIIDTSWPAPIGFAMCI